MDWSYIYYIGGTIALGYLILFVIKYLQERPKKAPMSQGAEIGLPEVKFIKKIAQGSYGEVWEGECRGTRVAIKKLFKKNYGPKQLEEFRREVEANTQKQHKNICLFMGAHTKNPTEMFFVVELLEPKTVGHLLRENVHISMLRRILMAKDCATGMSWLHGGDVQVLHRDLKPDNLLMDKDWNVKVCDFGLSRVKEKNDQRLSIGVGGTPLWIAPEVFRKEKLTPASDVYSFGLVLWEIVTGDVLFPDLEDFDDLKHQVLYKKLRPKIPEKNRQGEEIIPELGQLMRECWEDDPYRRPAFIDIAKRLEVIYVKVGLKDKEARNIWLKIMTKEDITTVELEKLCEELGIESEFTTMECLKRLIAHQDHRPRSLSSSKDDVASQEKKGSFICSIEDFAHAVNWFGPIDPLFSQRINSIVSCPFFVGPMDVKSAEENLEGENVLPGTFLVRASKTRPDAPFSLSVRQKEKISHIRINKKNNKFSVKIHNDQVIESTGTDLPAFINTISTVLALGKPLENANPYQSIFRKTNSEVHKDSKDPYGHYE